MLKNLEKPNQAEIKNEYGAIKFHPNVIQHLCNHITKEIPGVCERVDNIQVTNFFSKATSDGGKVKVSTTEQKKSINLTIHVTISGFTAIQVVAEQIQERIFHELPKILGLEISHITVVVDNITFE